MKVDNKLTQKLTELNAIIQSFMTEERMKEYNAQFKKNAHFIEIILKLSHPVPETIFVELGLVEHHFIPDFAEFTIEAGILEIAWILNHPEAAKLKKCIEEFIDKAH